MIPFDRFTDLQVNFVHFIFWGPYIFGGIIFFWGNYIFWGEYICGEGCSQMGFTSGGFHFSVFF